MKIRCVSLCVLIIFLAGCKPAIKNMDSAGHNIICFGNSITEGVGAQPDEAYPEVLGKIIGREIINAGKSGDTAAEALARVEEDVLSQDPFLVIVELGGNDFMRNISKKETLKNLREIIEKVHEAGAAVALCDISCGLLLAGYREDFERLAAKTGSILIPGVMEGILDNDALKSDYIHPNKNGYALIAQRVGEELKKYFDFEGEI